MLISPAYAQDATATLASAVQFLPLVLIFAVFYFLLIRPQQQKQKEMRQMVAGLKRGDRVVTGGGIIGTVSRVPMTQDKDGNQVPSTELEVEIAPNIKVTVLRETINSVVTPRAANDPKPTKGEPKAIKEPDPKPAKPSDPKAAKLPDLRAKSGEAKPTKESAS
jgi:preprotein translocase subunit YajC